MGGSQANGVALLVYVFYLALIYTVWL